MSKPISLCGGLIAVAAVIALTLPAASSVPLSLGAASTGRPTLSAVADAFVSAARPTRSFGRAKSMRADDTPKIAYVRFDMAAVPAGTVEANLELTGGSEQRAQHVDIYSVGNRWTEHTTYDDRPVLGSKLGGGLLGGGHRLVVTVPVPSSGPVSFAVARSSHGPDTVIATREYADPAARPRLEILAGTPSAAAARGSASVPAVSGVAGSSARAGSSAAASSSAAGHTAAARAVPAASATAGPYIPYGADSFLQTPLPRTGVPVATDSAVGIAFAEAHDSLRYPRINGVGGNDWGEPFALSNCSDPVWKLTGSVPPALSYLETQGLHAPQALVDGFTGTSDSPATVIDTCGVPSMPAGQTVWLFQAARGTTPGTIAVGGAGAYDNSSNGLDRRNPASDSPLNFTTNRGNVLGSGVIRNDLLAYAEQGGNGGTLGQVLEMFWVETNSAAGAVSPLVNAESGKNGYGAEGMRIRVKESWTPPASCAGPGRVIALTLQRYGAVIGDNSGSGSALKAQQGSTFPGLTPDALAPCISWSDMEFIAPGWGG